VGPEFNIDDCFVLFGIFKKKKKTWVESVAQVVGRVPVSKGEALSLNPAATKKKRKRTQFKIRILSVYRTFCNSFLFCFIFSQCSILYWFSDQNCMAAPRFASHSLYKHCICHSVPCSGQGPNLEYEQAQWPSLHGVDGPLGAQDSQVNK
jgi:hypothetical protein